MNRHPSWIFGGTPARRLPSVPAAPPPPPPPEPEEPDVHRCEPPPGPSPAELELTVELARVKEEKAALEDKLAQMTVRMARLHRDVLEASEPELVKLAMVIAERVVGRELAVDPALVVAWARESIRALGASDDVVIAVAPDVAANVPDDAWAELRPAATVRADPLLLEGTTEVRAPEGRIPSGAKARINAVAQALGVGDP